MGNLIVDKVEDGKIWSIELHRPSERNAMSWELVAELLALLAEAAASEDVRALIVHGHGKGFCAGSDLRQLAHWHDDERARFEALSGRLTREMIAHPLPIIAAIHGFAIGGGLTLAAACDIVVTTPGAKWSLPEVAIGLFPAWGLEPVALRIGQTRARRLAWGIDMLDGTEAESIGLADQLSDEPCLAAKRFAVRLSDLPRAQSAAVKTYFSRPRSGEGADAAANRLFIDACASPEASRSFVKFGGSDL